ncbi:FLYWCH zinc finger domain protein [Oopsacas minuta]|uniref:FLYWCH zinc finger domain protein n=1 Tax=Oopsacas minuta TaxID=111878 RepID=A0AAV7JRN3_9METZ|nr:FLYWCH zinc finger domain protein [Oopsacas minuta]
MACQILNSNGRIHTIVTSILKISGQHCHGEEIGKEEVLEFRVGVKRRTLESHDNPLRIIAEASGNLSQMRKLFYSLKKLKKICQRIRPSPTNHTDLFDLHVDENIQTLGRTSF